MAGGYNLNVLFVRLYPLVIRVVENERGGVIVCASSYGVADEPVNVGDATYAMLGFGASSESGFAATGRVHIARPFILSSFLSRRKKEGH
jgi:hypothetical protein